MIPYYDGSIELSRRRWQAVLKIHPDNPMSYVYYSLVLAGNNAVDEAISVIDHNARVNPGTMLATLGVTLKYAMQGNKEKLNQEITPDLAKTWQRDAYYSHQLADAFALIGDREKALGWLEHAVDAGFINYPFLSENDPLLESIRGDERFKKLMERVKLAWESFKAQ